MICSFSAYFVARLEKRTVRALGALVTVLLGGVVGNSLTANTHQQDAIWWYPIGLAIGVVLWIAVRSRGSALAGVPGLSALVAKLT